MDICHAERTAKNERARGQIVLVVKSAVLDRGKVVVFCCFYRVTSTRDVWGRIFAIFTIFSNFSFEAVLEYKEGTELFLFKFVFSRIEQRKSTYAR